MNKKSIAQVTVCICLAIMLLVLVLGFDKESSINSASAQSITQDNPTVIAVEPSSAPNDLDTLIIISGTGFSATLTDTQVITQPTVWLGDMQLTDAAWVTTTMLTATVPWGMNAGSYTLTVTNPDGGSGSLTNAFTVTLGIGQWNTADLFGGQVTQIMMKPGDPNTVYAQALEVGLFRSRDAGEHWKYVSNKNLGFGLYEIDPLHPSWLYVCYFNGLSRSQDEGDTWTDLLNQWPDGRDIGTGEVYASPYNPQVLFFSSAYDLGNPPYPPPCAEGLIKSTDGGASWSIVEDLEGIPVQDVSYHPTDPLKMVLATQAGKVFQSTDGGDTWSEVNGPPLSNIGWITYNPYKPSEVWVSLMGAVGLYKSTDPEFTSWINVTPGGVDFKYYYASLWFINFTSADSVYIVKYHSIDGGLTWQWFGPLTSYGEIRFDPVITQTGYIGDDTYGVQKTLDGGETWEIKSQGLTGMSAQQIETSQADPLRVYAKFGHWPGIYRSNDGANSWTFLPSDCGVPADIHEDPFNHQRIYIPTGSGFCISTDGGLSWSNLGWNIPQPYEGGPNVMEVDPYQDGHLLVGFQIGPDAYHLHERGQLYSSNDWGESWQPITVTQELELRTITSIVFHPDTPGLFYLASGTGVYRSTDHGNTWERIDDLQQPDMQYATYITIATHPQPMLLVGSESQYPYRTTDGGATWERPQNSPGCIASYLFLDGDSTRLYIATCYGLLFSRDAGDSWEPVAGVIGGLTVSALDYSVDVENNTTILYAATTGGDAGETRNMLVDTHQGSHTTESNLVEAGIYRYVQHIRQMFLPLAKR